MSRLTVTEKEHWKSRIERRINKAIEALEAKDDDATDLQQRILASTEGSAGNT